MYLPALRLAGLLEGISYLTLFGVTMPLKYLADMDRPNYYVGMAHGLLFVLYCVLVVLVSRRKKWSAMTTGLALLASVLPFGTFVADAKIFRRR